MPLQLIDGFHWYDDKTDSSLSAGENYAKMVHWAEKARGANPVAFDALTEWVLNDSQWEDDTNLARNQQVLESIISRFKGQNTLLREQLAGLESSGVVNPAVFPALNHFDAWLWGDIPDDGMNSIVARVMGDFSVMKERALRKEFAGDKTGPAGTDSVELFGYINFLKNFDAGVQWALFMPDMVKEQQKGFEVANFTYVQLPAVRFIGREGEDLENAENRKALFDKLSALESYNSEFPYDILLMHHYGLGVDVGEWHGFWGRFMQADTPVPEDFVYFDFVPENNGKAGPPFLSQFAFATFTGDSDAIHGQAGYDSDAMYDVTRNTMLGQGVNIPYPEKYWTAEVFLNGWNKVSTAYLFSSEK